jgi:hypothetical protein
VSRRLVRSGRATAGNSTNPIKPTRIPTLMVPFSNSTILHLISTSGTFRSLSISKRSEGTRPLQTVVLEALLADVSPLLSLFLARAIQAEAYVVFFSASSSHAQMNGSLEYAQAQQIALLQAHGQLPQSPASLHNARPTSSSGRPPSSHGRPSSSSGRLHPQQHFAHPSSQFVSLPSSASSSTSPFSWSAPNNQPPPPPPPPRHDSPRSHPYAPSGSRPRLISSRGVRGESGGITTRGIASGLETADFSRGVGGFEQMPLQTSIDPAGIRPQTSDGYSLGVSRALSWQSNALSASS